MRGVLVVVLLAACGRVGFDELDGRWASVSTSGDATCAITTSGELWCWGNSSAGNLGNGRVLLQPPARVGTLSEWEQVGVGDAVTCALRRDRSIECWGDGYDAPIAGTWQALAVAGGHVCALDLDGAMACWGDGSNGVLGNGQLASRSQPTPVSIAGTNRWTMLATSRVTTCGIQTDQSLWCWGENTVGQVGDNSTTMRTSPVQIGAGTMWIDVATGFDETCARDAANNVWCWGFNIFGQLGNGMPQFGSETAPTRATEVPPLTSIYAGRAHACGHTATGELVCWGNGEHGQFGQLIPQTPTPVTIAEDAALATTAGDVTCTIDSVARLSCTGANNFGQLGGVAGAVTTPAQSDARTDWMQIIGVVDHACGVTTANRVWCWGVNRNGELANGRNEDIDDPHDTASDATTFALGQNSSLGLGADGSVWLSGSDPGLSTKHLSPIAFAPAGSTKAVAMGDAHGCRIRSDDTLVCFGKNNYGQLGNSSMTDNQNAVVAGTWSTVAAAYNSTCAVTLTGSLYCWGRNTAGKLGNGNMTTQTTPQLIVLPGSVAETASGFAHTCARTTANEIYCWGASDHGQLGNGSTTGSTTPVRIGTESTWRKVVAGDEHTCALRSDNTLWCWGRGDSGEVGPSLTNQLVPVQVGGGQWRDVAAGTAFTCAVKLDGTRWCFGSNINGALGNGLGWRDQFVVIP